MGDLGSVPASSRQWMARLRHARTAMPWLTWMVLLVGFLGSVGAFVLVRNEVREGAASEFAESASGLAEQVEQVEQNIRAYADVIFSIRALLDASKDLDSEGFHRFAGGLAIDTRYPGITNISYSHRVDADGIASFEQRMRRASAVTFPELPPFAVKPPGARPESIVLSLMEPLPGNQSAFGLDLLADPVREAAVEAARDSGTLSTTAGMTLLRDIKTHALSVLLRLGDKLLTHRKASSIQTAMPDARGEMLQTCLGSSEAYEVVAKYLPGLLPGTSGALYRVESGRGNAERVAQWGTPSGIAETLQTSDCVAVRGGQARCVHNSLHELNCLHLFKPPSTCACLPLTSHGELLGLLHLQHDPDAGGGASDLGVDWRVVRTAADHISLAVANLSMRENLQEQATRDKLTGLYNRHYMSARLEQEKVRALRSGSTIAVIRLDIDHFKHFNDTYGHAAGDHVLREFAAQLRKVGRESDVACRYGGEEFVLFLPDASLEIAQRRAEEICLKTRSLQLQFESYPLGMVTVSAGVAVYPTHGANPDAVLQAADRALYRAKELGRDRVVLALPISPPTLPIDSTKTSS